MATTPGLNIRVNDGGMVFANLSASNARVLILATNGDSATTQEVDPKRVMTESQFVELYGALDVTKPLSMAWYQAAMTGCKDIRLQVIEGNSDATKYQNLHVIYKNIEDYDVDAVIVAGIEGDTVPSGVALTDNFDYCALNAEKKAISGESLAGADGSDKTWTLAKDFVVEGSVSITIGGTATTAYTVNYVTGEVTFTVAPDNGAVIAVSYSYYDFDVSKRSYMHQLAGFCETISAHNKVTHGFIALQKCDTLTLDGKNTYVNALTATPVVLSKYVVVVGGPQARFEWKDGTLYSDYGVGALGAYSELLPAQSSPTNKPLPGAVSVEFDLSSNQLDKLCTANIVSYRRKNGNVVITDGVTTAGASSDYTRFTTSKIIKEVINSTRTAAEPFIGEPNTMPQRNALRTAIDSALLAMQAAGAIEAYRFNVNTGISGMIEGNVNVDIQIVPIFEIRTININVTLKASL